MANKSITLSYDLSPPAETPQPIAGPSSQPVPASNVLSFPIPLSNARPSESSSSTSNYYSAASDVLRNVQTALNDLLTPWKDAIGDKEKTKEDLGNVGFGKGRAAMLSARVNGEMRSDSMSAVVEEEESSAEEDED